MKKCLVCSNSIPPNSRKYCSIICMKKCYQNHLKHINPIAYRRRLDKQNKRRRDKVRIIRGLPLNTPILNPNNGRGFKIKDGYKYLLKKDHPNSAKSGYVAEHVFIMSNHIGRPLNGKETVHHKNGIRDDNRIENLELWTGSHPYGQRVKDKIEWCKEFLNLYGYAVIKKD